MAREKLLEIVDFGRDGFIPVVVLDDADGSVLMLASMDRESLAKTLESGKMHYFSRSRNELWLKGEKSGHIQVVREIRVDCDPVNRLLFRVEQKGGACHTGYRTCFYRRVGDTGELEVVEERVFDPDEVYKDGK